MSKKLYHGAAYYPELWDKAIIEEDIRMMKETGINVVRIGEFAWAKMEPEEGKIDLHFFESVINKLYEHGIETVMCTPTPTPPIWMSHQHPERMYRDGHNQIMVHGSRQHICTNNRYFRERAAIITEQIAKSVGKLPGVIGWQLDNEFKCHVAECMCDTCNQLWHEWLEQRYGTIDALNEAWGTQIWSQLYQSFDQVPQPDPAPFLHNASLKTMYQLFSMDKIAEFADEQAVIIRKYSHAPITHNSTTMFSVDNERLFESLDFASFDTYATQENAHAYLFNCDIWRNLKKDRPFWVMETSPSHAASLASYASPHQDGYLRAEAVAAYALGGEGFCYWLWRQQRTGCELPHGSVLSAWGKPTVGYKNVLEVEKARKAIEPIMLESTASQADVALTYSDRAKVFMKTEPHEGLQYKALVNEYYRQLLETGIHRDLIPEGAELTGYKVLFTPFIHYLSKEYIERAQEFVENGGIWIIGPLTGGRTEHHTIHTDAALGLLDEIAGVESLFTFPMDGTGSNGKAFATSAPLGLWSTVFQPLEAKTIGEVESGIAAGKAFITECVRGKGKIVMLGSLPMEEAGEKLLQKLFVHYAKEANVDLMTDVSKGTIVAPREGNGKRIWVIVNMNGEGGTVTLPDAAVDVITNQSVHRGMLEVKPYEYRILQF
ncbi:beta-galactosidase [Bacillus sp. FJAT-50079]|uniref:beta-galactosidase n=1 Tax=Bacillus sp. FJAT-50079 TaxID=2833577 RepID=UPI001BCA0D05|nr:beta-galactosidase [Bacillus sp. FJAT-50079]MBS4207832.1 beta-galactosidase [Bacillus sp. FJAT-50079]